MVVKVNNFNRETKNFICDIFCNCQIKGHPHISNKILTEMLNFLDLAGLKPHNNQPLVHYKQGPNVTP